MALTSGNGAETDDIPPPISVKKKAGRVGIGEIITT